jgi:hypothetical protein
MPLALFITRAASSPGRRSGHRGQRHHQRQLDLVFRPVGAGSRRSANALNVMLARLLGRPEPGEEEHDEAATSSAGPLSFDTELSAGQRAVALARAGPDYHAYIVQRVPGGARAGENVEG